MTSESQKFFRSSSNPTYRVMFPQRSHAGGLIDRCKPGMDHSLDKLKRLSAWASILGILSLVMGFFSQLSGAGNTGEDKDFSCSAFPGVVELHAYPESVLKRRFVWASILGILSLLMEFFSQSSGAGNTGESARFAPRKPAKKVALVIVSSLALMIGSLLVSTGMNLFGIVAGLIYLLIGSLQVRVSLLQIVALVVIGSQARFKRHGEGQSSSGATGGSGAGSTGGSRDGGGDENGRIGRGIGEGRRNGMGSGAQRGGNEDDDDNDGRHMVGNLEDGRNTRPEDIANTFLPIILQSIAIITAIDGGQLSTRGRVIRSLSMIINLAAFICCTAVLWPLHTNPRVARGIMNPGIAEILSSIGSALAVLGFISMMAIYLPI